MSGDFTPTSVEEITRMATTYVPDSILGALSRTALAWLAERDAVTVERDQLRSGLEGEQKSRRRLDAQLRAELHISSDTSLMPVLRERLTEWGKLSRAKKAAEEARDLAIVERDEAYRQRDEALAKVKELQAEAAGVAYFACWPDGVLEAMGFTDVSSVAEVIERVNALVGAERERDRLLRSEADVCAILGAAPDELLSDAAGRVRDCASVFRNTVNAARLTMGAAPGQALGVRASDVMAELRLLREAAESEPPQEDLREILRARDGEPLGDAARRLAASRDEMMEEASRARTELGARTNESAEDAALRVMRSLLKAQSALGEVFEIQHEITVAGDLVTIRVAPLRDPAIRALPLGVRLGLVVCDG